MGSRSLEFIRERNSEKIRECYNSFFMKSPNKNLGFEFRPNVDLDLKSVKGLRYSMHVKTNSLGLRENEDIPLRKPKDTVRLIGLGDSVIFGASVDNDETMLKWIEKFGKRRGLKIQTLNYGIGPSSPEYEYHYFVYKRGVDYHPDILILGFCLHDFSDTTDQGWLKEWIKTISGVVKTEKKNKVSNIKGIRDFFLGNLSFIKVLRELGDKISNKDIDKNDSAYQYGDSPETCRESKGAIKYWIRKIYNLAEANNVKFIMVIFPLRDQLRCLLEGETISLHQQETALEICRELNVDCYDTTLDMLKVIKENNYNLSNVFWDSTHPYKLGHKILGELILEFLICKGYVDISEKK